MWQHKRIFLMVAVYSRDSTVSLKTIGFEFAFLPVGKLDTSIRSQGCLTAFKCAATIGLNKTGGNPHDLSEL